MYLEQSLVSCGVNELVDVEGADAYYDDGEGSLEAQYRRTMCDVHCAMIIASLTTNQKEGIALLKRHGFKAVNRARKNPNSGNKIILFVKQVTPPRKKKPKVSSNTYAHTQMY